TISCASSRDRRTLHSFPTRRSSDLWPPPNSHRLLALVSARRLARNLRARRPICQTGRKSNCCRSTRVTGSTKPTVQHCTKLCGRSEEHTSELQSRFDLVCRLLREKK